jgi:cold shock CspA family protein
VGEARPKIILEARGKDEGDTCVGASEVREKERKTLEQGKEFELEVSPEGSRPTIANDNFGN